MTTALTLLALLIGCGDKEAGDDRATSTTTGGSTETWPDADGDGYDSKTDCDDDDVAINPGAPELCNELDDDCDGLIDDEDELDPGAGGRWYTDDDGDGFGDDGSETQRCEGGDGWTKQDGDCDDSDAAVNPDATEICSEGVDDDCSGWADDEDPALDPSSRTAWYRDEDADGYGSGHIVGVSCAPSVLSWVDNDEDCNDDDDAVSPAALELCNAIDDDCDGLIDDEDDSLDPSTTDTVYDDVDLDGFGDTDSERQVCTAAAEDAAVGGDCDDSDPAVSPAATEICNGSDDDCDGLVDDDDDSLDESGIGSFWADLDGDGFGEGDAFKGCDPGDGWAAVDGDCDDDDPAVSPGAAEVCNDIDDDCDDRIDGEDDDLDTATATAWYPDGDGDGFGDETATAELTCDDPGVDWVDDDRDCDDDDDAISPDAAEICNGIDDDCDGDIPDDEEDRRGDGYPDCLGAAHEVGADEGTYEERNFMLANILLATEDATLKSYRVDMDRPDDCDVHMYVYRTDAWSETVTPDVALATLVEVEEGSGWVESGGLDLSMTSGTYYWLAVSWECDSGVPTVYVTGDDWSGTDLGVATFAGQAASSAYSGYSETDAPELSAFTSGALHMVVFLE